VLFKDTVDTLVKFYSEGGIVVCTSSNSSGNDDCDENLPLLAKTVIQPDADVITHLSERILERPAAWQMHLDEIKGKIDSIYRLKFFLKWIKLLSIPFTIWGGYNFYYAKLEAVLLAIFLILLFLLVKPLAGFYFQQRLKREMKLL